MTPYLMWWRFWLTFWQIQTRTVPACPPSCPIINLARWRADHPSSDDPTRGRAA
jgi:hypothetical protein